METILGAVFGLLLMLFVLIPIQVYEWLGPWLTALSVSGIVVAIQGIRFVWRRRRQLLDRVSFKNS